MRFRKQLTHNSTSLCFLAFLYSVLKVHRTNWASHNLSWKYAPRISRLVCASLNRVLFGFSAFSVPRGIDFSVPSLLVRELPRRQPLVGSNGLEPSTSRLSGVRSNHLSYEPISVAVSSCHSRPTCCCAVLFASRVPTCRSYSLQRVLPPAQLVVEMNRIELSTPCLQGRCSPS